MRGMQEAPSGLDDVDDVDVNPIWIRFECERILRILNECVMSDERV